MGALCAKAVAGALESRPFGPGLACLAASFFAASCATPYRPVDHSYGYFERQIGTNVYEVGFLGNGQTSYERACDFAMLRAAEIALDHHAKAFILLDLVNLSSVRRYHIPSQYYWTSAPEATAGARPAVPAAGMFDGPDWSYLMFEPAQEGAYYRPGVKLTIKLLPDPPGSYYPYYPSAESERLRRKYRIKPVKPKLAASPAVRAPPTTPP
jgi:hypothetical protein